MKRYLSLVMIAILLLAIVPEAASARSGAWIGSSALRASSFQRSATDGFGDKMNSYAWSMAEFKGDVYVGTARLVNLNTIMPMISELIDFEMPAMPGTPPNVFDWLDATATAGPTMKDEAKYQEWNSVAHAEVWRYHAGEWTRVFQAQDVPSFIRSPEGTYPYATSEITGLRSMSVFTDKNGVQALYATSGGSSFGHPAIAPKIIRTTDGVTWERLSTPPGMGRETRASTVHSGKLYAGASTAATGYESVGTGTGSVWATDNPGDTTSWTKVLDFAEVDPTNSSITSIASFNNRVYVGTENTKGFQVWRSTVANPTSSADWVRVMNNGGGDMYNLWAGTMKVFKGNLYVGSIAIPGLPGRSGVKGFDLFRISSTDSVRMIAGNIKPAMPVTEGALRRRPASGLPSGFGNPLNMYCWSLEVYKDRLYLGSLDQSGMFGQMLNMEGIPAWVKYLPLEPFLGADLWGSSDGTMWSPVFLNGLGASTNYGIRTMKTTADGRRIFLGTANPFTGCQVWKSK